MRSIIIISVMLMACFQLNRAFAQEWQVSEEEALVVSPLSTPVGIGVDFPATDLDVNGTVQMNGFKLTTTSFEGYVLTSDDLGDGTWQPIPFK
ncbi:MAG: hypothetical protein GWN00_25510, partial [Aliifodinibius sp.]|nr:hypothetical protein [Fodinibius sp.]NIV14208.1 hypothetical protein [Fodinibius sp.]NIY28036.1 hypothetical protein [Fodinibius sp.]